MNQKTREEVDSKYKWDLSLIYENDEVWLEDFTKVSDEIIKIKDFQGKLTKSAKDLLNYLELSIELERKLYKLYYYAHLKHDEDTTNSNYQELLGKITNLLTLYSEYDSYANPELMEVDFNVIESFIKEEKRLEDYRFVLEQLYRYKPHILDKNQEEMLSILGNIFEGPEKTYGALTDADLKFGKILVDGKEVELTDSNYSTLIKHKDRNVRKEVFTRYYDTYQSYKNTIANTYSANVDVLTSLAKLKNYNSSIEASLFDDNIDLKVYNNLIDTVSNNLDVIYKYFKLKKDILKLDELHLYDIYVDLIKDYDKEYTFLEAKEEVINALSILGENYISIINKAFDEKWIDVYNNKGKRSGAYSSGFYDTKPYILLNYEGKAKDVSTLAHELGHSAHTYLSCTNNKYQYSSYKIFVAEVASTVNELLLNHYRLSKSQKKEEKLFILNEMMELFKGTIYRQVMFAEFEKITHEKKEQGEVLTYEYLSNIYYDLNKKYFGNDVIIDELIKYEWERIPHFYYNFYVYKYAIGLSSACYIVDNILNNKENALDNYLKFLSSGSTDYPANLLKIAGVDVTDSKVIESAIKMFDNIIDEFKELID